MTLPFHHRGWLCAIGAAALFHVAPPLCAQAGSSPAQQSATPASAPVSAKRSDEAERAYLSGAKHLSASDFNAAEKDFARAVVANPAKQEYLLALELAREHRVTDLLQRSAQERTTNPVRAESLLQQARALDGSNPQVLQHDAPAPSKPIVPVRRTQMAGVIVLQPNTTRHSYHERIDLNRLSARLASDFGIKAVIDPELPAKPFRIDVDDVNFDDAMRIFTMLTNTMFVPLDTHTIVIAEDKTENRQRYEHLVEETYYLPGMTADQIKDFVSIAQNIFSLRQVSVQPMLNALVMRGPADLVEGANKIFADLMQGDSDVVISLKLYAIDKQHVQNLGVVLPSSLNAFSLASQAQSIVSTNQSLVSQLIASGVIPSTANIYEIAAYLVFVGGVGGTSSLFSNSFVIFGGGATTGALSVGNIPTINLALNNSEARTLDDVQLRVGNRQTATFKTGMRYPIQTSLYSDIASSTTSSLAGATVNGVSLSSLLSQYLGSSSVNSGAVIPQVQYEDLGFTLTAIPHIQRTSEVGMHLEMKINALAGSSLNGIPVLANRQFTSDLTIGDGETAMMISNTSQSELNAVTGVPGLGELPGFQSTTNRNTTVVSGDLVLMITPHIVRKGHTREKGPYIPLAPRPDDD